MSVTEVYALEEMLHSTLAVRCGGKPRKYPDGTAAYTRAGVPISVLEAQEARKSKDVYFVHPVKRDPADPARLWISGAES